MVMVLGVDPGSSGALAVYDTVTRSVVGDVYDIPVWFQTVGKRKRKRVDILALADYFDTFALMGVELIVMETVGVRPQEGAVGAFAFGYTVGVIYTAAFYSGIALDSVTPSTWKQCLAVSGKAKADDSAIMQRAYELFPKDRTKFEGVRGGKRVDRAEAAMIAKYGADFVLPNLKPMDDVERRVAFAAADTGA